MGLEFQSTPPRGWRHSTWDKLPSPSQFQSTPPRGWRRGQGGVDTVLRNISIHSTTRVETAAPLIVRMPRLFQSTPPRGWRRHRPRESAPTTRFQSTPPRGWRLLCFHFFLLFLNFNPLHHEGGDFVHL